MSIKPSIAILLLILIVFFPLFNFLDAPPILQWDEGRLAVSSFEMSNSHNWIVTTINDKPDNISTKPPLMIWLQVLMMKVVGTNELAVRLPSALAALGTCLLLFFFFTKKNKEPLLGLICAIVLVTTQGYVTFHGTRTGDYDSLLTMLMLGYTIFFFLYLDEGKRKYLYITFFLLILSALTKGIQSLIFLPGLFIYAIYKMKLATILKQKEFYFGIVAFLFFVIGYYLLRDHFSPGYIDAVKREELGGRYNAVLGSHVGDEWFYYDLLVNDFFHEWYLLVLPGIIAGLCNKQKWIKEITIYSAILVFTYLLVISGAKTKISWYLMPIFPFLAMIVGVFLFSIYRILNDIDNKKQIFSYNFLPLIFLFFVFIIPYKTIVTNVVSNKYSPYERPEETDMEQFMKNVLHNNASIDSCMVLNEDLGLNVIWYYEVIRKQHQLSLVYRYTIPENGKIVVFLGESKKYIEDHFNTEIAQKFNNVTVYKLNGRKKSVESDLTEPNG